MDGSSTHHSTSRLAGDAAIKSIGSRRGRILQLLADRGPSTIFEIAGAMELHDHQISGRFGELEREALIAKTGERRAKPETGCLAEVYRLAEAARPVDRGEALNGPDTLILGEEGIFERQPWAGHEDVPGVPYARRTAGGVPRVLYRVAVIECEGCGKPVRLVVEGGVKKFRCGTVGCGRTWRLMLVNEPGRAAMPALVMTYL